MKRVAAFLVLAVSVAFGAAAQSTTSSSPDAIPLAPVSADPDAQTAHYIAGRWTYPSYDVIQSALDNTPTGEVVLDCAVGASGAMTSCDVVGEPFTAGIGKAVAAVFVKYCHVDPASVPGGIQDGDRHKFTYRW